MRKGIGLLLAIVLLVACEGMPAGETTGQEIDVIDPPDTEGTVVAEAVIEPARWSALGFGAAGEVIEVLVEEGDTVAVGDLLVRLDPTDAELAVGQAEVALQAAQARLALLEAGARPQEIALVEAQLEAAEERVAQASAQVQYLMSGPADAEIAAAEAEIAALVAERDRAKDTHELTMTCFDVEIPFTGEKVEVCPNLGPREEQARAALQAAEEALAAAQARLQELRAGPDSNEARAGQASVEAAAANREAIQAQLDLTRAGPAQEELAVAAAEVTRARTALEAAEAALEYTEVRAPFAGTISMLNAELGNVVVPGQVACVLATLNHLQARTKDLSELDVGGIEPGQSVKITVDALSEREFEGTVRRVAQRAEDFRGQVVYAVVVDLPDGGDAPLRWGMTAWLEFVTP